MPIRYNETKKDLPCEQLHKLFIQAGWSNGKESQNLKDKFNYPFLNSTIVISAWDGEKLVGAVRAISDKTVRSIIQDLVVDKQYQHKGIGKELLSRCIKHFPNSEWTVTCSPENKEFYIKQGFVPIEGVDHLKIKSKYF